MSLNIFEIAELIAFLISMYLTIDTGFKFYNYKKYPRIFSFHSYWKAYNWLGRKKLHTTIRLQQSAPKISDRNCPHMFCKISYEIRKKDAMKKENLIALEERIKKGELNRRPIGERYS